MITRWEIAARHPDGRHYLIAYTPRKSRPGLLAAMRDRHADVIRVLEIGTADIIEWPSSREARQRGIGWPCCCFSGGWWVGFSGRTQLESRHDGELPYIAEVVTIKIEVSA